MCCQGSPRAWPKPWRGTMAEGVPYVILDGKVF
jgi:hypothetical protein